MPSPGGLQGTWCRECFLCLCVMVKHTEQGGQDAGLLAQKTGAGLTVSAWFSLPAACYQLSPLSSLPRPHPPVFQTLPPIWSGPSFRPDQNPMVYALVPPLCSVLSSDTRGCFLCVFVRGHPVPLLYSGNLWEGLGRRRGRGGEVRSRSHLASVP